MNNEKIVLPSAEEALEILNKNLPEGNRRVYEAKIDEYFCPGGENDSLGKFNVIAPCYAVANLIATAWAFKKYGKADKLFVSCNVIYEIDENGEEIKQKKHCSHCGKVVDESAKFCSECGAFIVELKHCDSCGAEVRESDKYCPECGRFIK